MKGLFSDMYRYRGLLWALVNRHLATRYRGSVFGFLWSFLNPLCLMLVYTLVFRHYIRFDQVPHYTVFLFCGLLPWMWFSGAVSEGTLSIVSSGHLITKSMFPPQILPTVAVVTTMVNFLLSLPLLFLFMWWEGVAFTSTLFMLPLVVAGQFLFLIGTVFLLSAINVQFRDTQHLVANFLTLLFFLTPIVYPPESIPEGFRWMLDYNPLALLTTFYQDIIMDGVVPTLSHVVFFGGFIVALLLIGQLVFGRYRETFAELL